jgi:hypothetical protein
MNDQEITDWIREGLESVLDIASDEEEIKAIQGIRTFEEAMVLTNNKGLVITMVDGTEFQVSVIRSK